MKRFLIVRTDRIGDVLLTTPLGAALREQFPGCHITWLVRPYTAPLLERNPEVDQVLLDRGQRLRSLIEELRRQRIDAALVAYPRWRTVWALWRAGVPRRIGPANKPYSVLLTDRLWQHRSQGKRHEADFNLDLLTPLGASAKRHATRLVLSGEERTEARRLLESHRLTFQKPVVGLHPGSGGSAPRWPLARFMALGDRLQEAGCEVVVTAGPGETYQSVMIDQMRRLPVFIPAGSVTVRELAALFSCMDLVVSNSTGPLHLAVAAGVRTVSVYPAIVTCHPRRWGPYPGYPEGDLRHRVVLAPDTGIPEADLTAVTVESVEALCREALAAAKRSG